MGTLPEPIELHITFDQQTGNVQVTGPLPNKLLCYGMLELAKDVIREFKGQAAPELMIARVIPPNGQPHA